jgi:hypothetical protein
MFWNQSYWGFPEVLGEVRADNGKEGLLLGRPRFGRRNWHNFPVRLGKAAHAFVVSGLGLIPDFQTQRAAKRLRAHGVPIPVHVQPYVNPVLTPLVLDGASQWNVAEVYMGTAWYRIADLRDKGDSLRRVSGGPQTHGRRLVSDFQQARAVYGTSAKNRGAAEQPTSLIP